MKMFKKIKSEFSKWNSNRKRSKVFKLKVALKREVELRKDIGARLKSERDENRRLSECLNDLRHRSEKYWLGYDTKEVSKL